MTSAGLIRTIASWILLATIVAGVASCKPAPAAEWVVFETMPEATIYVDPSTIKVDGERAEMWALIDYRQPQPDKTGKQVLSDKIRYEYDCKLKLVSITDTSAHAGPMATGDIININPDPPQVAPVPADSTAEKLWRHACGHRATG